jgi:hypothetical protein
MFIAAADGSDAGLERLADDPAFSESCETS